MSNFRNDLEKLINNGTLTANKGKIRFVFKYGNRLKGSLDDLDLNTRGYNCLRRNGIHDIKAVSERWDDLYKLKGSGNATIKEVKNRFLDYYYSTLNSDYDRAEFWMETINATVEL